MIIEKNYYYHTDLGRKDNKCFSQDSKSYSKSVEDKVADRNRTRKIDIYPNQSKFYKPY